MTKRILIHSEASYLKTGYAKITLELCKRLHDAGYIVAEASNYGHVDYPGKKDIPWMHYALGAGEVFNQAPSEQETNAHNSDVMNQFGKWRIGDVLLHFKPDVVYSPLDHWMSAHILHHPLKHCFKMCWMPACDASPQNEQWISDYIASDFIFTYTDFAYETLKKEGGGLINLCGVAGPGVDNKVFLPIHDKKQHKNSHGIPPNARIVGTVMRNQRRKLFPDLFASFRKFLDKCETEDKEIGQNTFLYCHTSFPDVGWNLYKLLKENGLSHKVYFTYICHACGAAFPSFFNDVVCVCASCNQAHARFPSTQIGISDSALNLIYNLFDVYVQYANSEGIGMPGIEAAAAGIHPIYTNYSGMEDYQKFKGTPIGYKLSRESETHCNRALPDNDEFANKLLGLMRLPDSILLKRGFDARRGAIKHFSWDDSAKKLMGVANQCEGNWGSPPDIKESNLNIPQGLDDSNFIKWCIVNILGDTDKINNYVATQTLKELSMGLTANYGDIFINEDSVLGSRNRLQPFNRQNVVDRFKRMRDEKNMWEARRCGLDKSYQTPKWLLKSISK